MDYFYAGKYSNEGLQVCRLNKPGESHQVPNTSYLCKAGRYLYAVLETAEYEGQHGGGVAAYEIKADGQLQLINIVATGGAAPCHLVLSPDNRILYVAHYTDGTTAIFDIADNGGIGGMRKLIEHRNFGIPSNSHPGRQQRPHAHYAGCWNDKLWLCDLGLDMVLVLDLDGKLLHKIQTPKGSGPRHLAAHPYLPVIYLVCELDCSVISIEWTNSGPVQKGEPVSTLSHPNPKNTCAAIRVSPGGKYLLASNRGTDSIAVFRLMADGSISEIAEEIHVNGNCPRDFNFRGNDMVYVACQESNVINIFRWDESAGFLTSTGEFINIDSPVCLTF